MINTFTYKVILIHLNDFDENQLVMRTNIFHLFVQMKFYFKYQMIFFCYSLPEIELLFVFAKSIL